MLKRSLSQSPTHAEHPVRLRRKAAGCASGHGLGEYRDGLKRDPRMDLIVIEALGLNFVGRIMRSNRRSPGSAIGEDLDGIGSGAHYQQQNRE